MAFVAHARAHKDPLPLSNIHQINHDNAHLRIEVMFK